MPDTWNFKWCLADKKGLTELQLPRAPIINKIERWEAVLAKRLQNPEPTRQDQEDDDRKEREKDDK